MAATMAAFNDAADYNNGSFTITKPTGTVSGDLLVAVVVRYEDSGNVGVSFSAPTGWTEQATAVAAFYRVKVVYKVAGGSEPANYTWTYGSSGDSYGACGAISRITGADTSNIFDGGPTYQSSTSTTASEVCPSVSPATSDGLLLLSWIFQENFSDVTLTMPGGVTGYGNYPDAAGLFDQRNGYKALSASGATGTQTATASASMVAQHNVSMVIRSGSTAKSATETGSSSDTISASLVSLSSADTGSSSETLGNQARGSLEFVTSTDLGSLDAVPVFATDTGFSVENLSALLADIEGFDAVTHREDSILTVPPFEITDYEFLHVFDFEKRIGKGPYRFRLPYTEGERAKHRFFRRISVHRGLSLLRIGGTFRLIPEPTYDDFASADVIYLGGYDYWVTDEQAQDLGDAGYDGYIEGFVFVPDAYYGAGQYGVSVYGN